MIEAGVTDTVKLLLRFRYRCARPTGGRMVAPPTTLCNPERAQSEGRAWGRNPKSAATTDSNTFAFKRC